MCRIPIAAVPVAVALALSLGGCVPYYRVPSDVPFASVRLMTSTDDRTTFNILDPARCPSPRPQVLAGTGKQLASMGRDDTLDMAGIPPEPPSRTRERKVLPGKRIYVAVTSYAAPPADDARCAAGVSFIPQVGGQYEIRYRRDEAATQCTARVLRLRPDAEGGATVVQEPTQQGFRALRPEYLCEAGAEAGPKAGAGTR